MKFTTTKPSINKMIGCEIALVEQEALLSTSLLLTPMVVI